MLEMKLKGQLFFGTSRTRAKDKHMIQEGKVATPRAPKLLLGYLELRGRMTIRTRVAIQLAAF